MVSRGRAKRIHPRQDAAGADIVGTLLIFALTVAIGAVVGVAAWNMVTLNEGAPPAAFDLDVQEDTANLTRVSGDVLDLGLTTVRWYINDTLTASVATKYGNGTHWQLGESMLLTNATIGPSTRVEARIYHNPSGTLIASVAKRMPTAATSTNGGPTLPTPSLLLVTADGITPSLYKVKVEHPEGLAYVKRVQINLSILKGLKEQALTDDGADGDETAGDGTYSTEVAVPPLKDITKLYYNVTVTATDMDGRTVTGLQPLKIIPSTLAVGAGACPSPCQGTFHTSTGSSYHGVPNSTAMRWINVGNITFDPAKIAKIENDNVRVHITKAGGNVWTAIINFGLDQATNSPKVTSIVLTSGNQTTATTTSGSTSNTCTPSATVLLRTNPTLNLHAPSAMSGWTCGSGTTSFYANAGITSPATLTIIRVGDDGTGNTNQGATSPDTALINSDLSFG